MPLFDSLCNAFATAGTGGFAIKADSFAGYSAYAQTVTTVFMALFGVNFSIYFFLLQKKFDLALKNTELRWYVGIILTSIAIITANILPMYPELPRGGPPCGVLRLVGHYHDRLLHGKL